MATIGTLYEGESHSVVSDSLPPHGLCSSWNSPGQDTEVGSHSLLQGIFPTQGSNTGLLHCRQILYQLSHKRRPREGQRKNVSSSTRAIKIQSGRGYLYREIRGKEDEHLWSPYYTQDSIFAHLTS